jgi:succinoglycan biosynthesis transport protein ExoP
MVTVEEFDSVPTAPSSNIQPLIRFIKRKAWLIAGVAGIVTGVGTWYTIANTVPIYQGAFQLLVEPVSREGQLSDPASITGSSRNNANGGLDYSTQLRILQSPKMIEQILAGLQTQYPSLTEDELRANLAIGRVGGNGRFDQSKIVEVRYQSENPQAILDVLLVTADEYLEYSLEERKSNLSEGVKFIDEQLPKLRQDVDTLNAQIQALRQQYNFLNPEAQASGVYEETRELATQQMELQRQLQELGTRYVNLRSQLNVTPEEAADELLLRGDPAYQELLGQIKQLNIELASESTRFQVGSPTIQFLQEKQQNLQILLAQETQRILGRSVASARLQSIVENQQSESRTALLQEYINISNELEALQSRNQLLTQDRAIFEQQVQMFPAIERQYRELVRQAEIATKTLDEFSLKKQLLQVEVAQEQFPWEVIAEPELRQQPNGELISVTEDSLQDTVVKLGLLGVVLGVGIAFLIEKLQNRFYSDQEIEEVSQLPLLATIPAYQHQQRNLPASDTLTPLLEGSSSPHQSLPFAKSFDTLYTNLRLSATHQSIGSLAVCSAEPQNGKSTVAIHLAQAAALTGKKVLLVDADLPHPQLHDVFKLPNQRGLSDLLLNPDSSIDDFVYQSSAIDNLYVMTAGTHQSTRLLGSERLAATMEMLAANFELVIYDTPYLADYSNTNLLAAHTDGVTFVIDSKNNKRSTVKSILEKAKNLNVPVLGIVVNQIPKRKKANLHLENFTQMSSDGEQEPDAVSKDVEIYSQAGQ